MMTGISMSNQHIEESIELAESLRCFLKDYYREELNENAKVNPVCIIAALMSVLINISEISEVPKDILKQTFFLTLEENNYGQEN